MEEKRRKHNWIIIDLGKIGGVYKGRQICKRCSLDWTNKLNKGGRTKRCVLNKYNNLTK